MVHFISLAGAQNNGYITDEELIFDCSTAGGYSEYVRVVVEDPLELLTTAFLQLGPKLKSQNGEINQGFFFICTKYECAKPSTYRSRLGTPYSISKSVAYIYVAATLTLRARYGVWFVDFRVVDRKRLL